MSFDCWPVDILSNYGLKKTHSRMMLLEIFLKRNRSLTAQELRDLDNVGLNRVTMHRVLKDLTKAGILQTFYDAWGALRYELQLKTKDSSTDNYHGHFSCISCKKVFCLNTKMAYLENLPRGYFSRKISLLIEGLCPNCHVNSKLSRTTQAVIQ